MPTLHWIGKEKVINHHLDVPFRVLEHKLGFDQDGEKPDPVNSGNKIIHGDNLEALKALLPEYEGRVKCIYIDPPYNTGNEGWVYNDNVNDPKILKWLNDTIKARENGTDASVTADDLTRHDKWLCMMYPRLKLLSKLLAGDGAIFVSIDDNEEANLKLLLDEIFGSNNFVGKITWFKKRKGSYLSKEFVSLTEYVFVYRGRQKLQLFGGQPNSEESQPLIKRTNTRGKLHIPAAFISTKLADGVYSKGSYGKGTSGVHLQNDVTVADGKFLQDVELEGPFIWSQNFLNAELEKGTKVVINTPSLQPRVFRDSEDKHKGFPSFIDGREISATTDDAYETLKAIFESDRIFDYSKPYQLISYLINSITYFNPNAIVLDSFAGSGTTAHAVLKLNQADGGNRKFICIEMEEYARNITTERIKKVINGYGEMQGTGGSFNFYELGSTLFKEDGYLNELCGRHNIYRYVWYTETREPYSRPDSHNEFLLGKHNDNVYYFIYEEDGTTTLDYSFLSTMDPGFRGAQYVIYADNCLLPPDFMQKKNIAFKKIPRDITRF